MAFMFVGKSPKSLNAVLEHVLQKFTIGGEQNMAHKFQKSFCNVARLYKKRTTVDKTG